MDKDNFSHGGEIPAMLKNALLTNQDALKEFTGYSSSKKTEYIKNSRRLKSYPEIKCYVDARAESVINRKENSFDLFE